MTVKTGTFYWVVCSCCGRVADEDYNQVHEDEAEAIEESENFDFMAVLVGEESQHLCQYCWRWPEEMPGYDEATRTSDDPVRAHDQHPVKAVEL